MAVINPELTPTQKDLLNAFWDTTITAKVTIITMERGKPQFHTEDRQMRPIDFKREGEEGFAFKHHEKDPLTPPSPTYVRLGNLPDWLTRKVAMEIANAPLPNLAPPTRFSTGIPDAGVPLGKAYAEVVRSQYIDILSKVALEDGQRRVTAAENALLASGYPKSLMIVDDLITEGNSKWEAIQPSEGLGYFVVGVAALIDREQGGKRFLVKQGYAVYTAMTFMQTIEYYRDTRRITEEQYKEAAHYQKLAA